MMCLLPLRVRTLQRIKLTHGLIVSVINLVEYFKNTIKSLTEILASKA